MSSLSPEARKLLESTRDAGGPSAAQRANMKRAVLAGALLPGTAAAAPSTSAAAVTSAKAAGLGIAAKLTIAAVVSGLGVGVLATWQLASPGEEPAVVVVTPVVRAPEPVAVAVAEPVVVAEVVAPVVAAPPPPAPARVAPAVVVAAPEPAPAPVPEEAPAQVPPPPVDEETLSREVAALSGTMNAVDARQFSVALEQLGGYRAAFPHGALETEASVLEVLALCGLGRGDEARAVGRALPANNPAVRRLDRSCIAKPR